MSAHRTLKDLYKAFTNNIGPGLLQDPGDAGTITVEMWGQICPVVTAAAETRTLAQPNRAGLQAAIVLDTDGGDLTLTVTGGYNEDGTTTITLDDAGDFVVVYSVKVGSSYYWRIAANEGTSVATKPLLVVTAVTAVGSVQSLATNSLAPGLNVIKGGGTNLGVSLPKPVAGTEVIVKNTSGSTAIVYGNATAVIINALATTTGFSVATTKTTRLICENSTQWWTDPLAIA